MNKINAKAKLYEVVKNNGRFEEGFEITAKEVLECITSKNELVRMLDDNSGFRSSFEDYLWEVFMSTESLDTTLYRIYFDMKKQEFARYEFINSSDWIPNDDLIWIIDLDGDIWDTLYYEYDALKEAIEKDGDTITHDFYEWIDEEIKGDYIENTVDLIIRRLQDEI